VWLTGRRCAAVAPRQQRLGDATVPSFGSLKSTISLPSSGADCRNDAERAILRPEALVREQ